MRLLRIRKKVSKIKKIIMLVPNECASGDTREFGIYKVISDRLCEEVDDVTTCNEDYTIETRDRFPNAQRWITIEDESSTDDFMYCEENEDRFIFCNDTKELAHALIDLIGGLDETIVNMAEKFRNK